MIEDVLNSPKNSTLLNRDFPSPDDSFGVLTLLIALDNKGDLGIALSTVNILASLALNL